MIMPNFIIVGAPKCGTTSLYHYLNQHPQIFMSPNKEPGFFAYEGKKPIHSGPGDRYAWTAKKSIVNLKSYQALFEDSGSSIARGEATTMYLYLKEAPVRIHKYLPNAKIIMVLRDPIERAFSHYLQVRRDNREWIRDFSEALKLEDKRIEKNFAPAWHYRHVSLYSTQVQRYLKYFSNEQIRIYLYDDFIETPQKVIQDIFDFLGVDSKWQPDMSNQHNTMGNIPKCRLLNRFLYYPNPLKSALRLSIPPAIRKDFMTQISRRNVIELPTLDKNLRKEVLPLFLEDISKLQTLIHRDLSHWLV